jgi:hypothetical protein
MTQFSIDTSAYVLELAFEIPSTMLSTNAALHHP